MEIEKEIKQVKFDNSFQKAIINLIYTSNIKTDSLKAIFKPFGISLPQFNVLKILRGKHPEACSAGEIKAVMLDKSPDLTRLVDRLIEKGFASRNICNKNRRKVDICITVKGLHLLERIEPVLKQQMYANKTLNDDEAEKLSYLLDKLRG